MSLIYKVKSPDGQDVEMNALQIMQQANAAMQGSDKQILAVTPDGMYAQVSQAGQQFTVPIQALLGAAGIQVGQVMPPEDMIDATGVSPSMRYAISNLEDDGQKKKYLQTKMAEAGIQNAEIIGSGRDFYYYDGGSGKYRAITNSPSWDVADLAEGLTTGTRIAGGIAGAIGGGAIGAGAGPAGVVGGGMVGSGAGTAGAETLTRGLAALDPAYREAFDMRRAAEEGGKATAISAAAPGVLKGVGSLASKYLPGWASKFLGAPASNTAIGAGKVAEGTGKVMNMAQIGATPAGKFVGSILAPGTQHVTMTGAGATVPQLLVQGGAKVAEKMGARPLGGTAEEILGNVGSRFANVGSAVGKGGINLNPAQGGLAADAARQAAGRKYGEQLGGGIDALSRGGQTLIKGSEEAFGAASRGLAATGRGVSSLGRGVTQAGRAAAPYEAQTAGQIGARAATGEMRGPLRLPSGPLGPNQPLGGPRTVPVQNPYGYYVPPLRDSAEFQAIEAAAGQRKLPAGYIPYDLEI